MRKRRNVNKILKGSAKVLFALLFLTCSLYFGAGSVSAEGDGAGAIQYLNGHPCKAGEVLVVYSENQLQSSMAFSLNAAGSGVEKNIGRSIALAKVPEGKTLQGFINELMDMPGVSYAQPNYVYALDTTEVNDTYIDDQWHLEKIEAFEAWDITMGSEDIKVAVLDSGIDQDHEDLIGQVVAQTDVVDGDGIADDDNGHGTHVCGIIAAIADNGLGVAGVAPGVKLIVADVFEEVNPGEWLASTSDNILGVEFAVAQGADVINMSFGGYDNDNLFKDALDDATEAGVVCVGAAGNENNTATHYPSDYESCISVISTTYTDAKSSFSNYGSAKDISAPGSSIKSTSYTGGYVSYSGTSMAAPVVSGVAALMLSANPSLSVDDVKRILNDTAVDLGDEGKDDLFANGRVDASAAVAEAVGGSSILDIRLCSDTAQITTATGMTLTYETFPAAASGPVIWSSSYETAATVSDGVVTGHNAGITNITVSTPDGTVLDTCRVTVMQGVDSMQLDTHEENLESGGTVDITALVYPINAYDPSVTWSSSNPAVASVEATSILTCTVTANSGGTAVITATASDGGITDTCTINVSSVDVESAVYAIDQAKETISGVFEKTSPDSFKANLLNDPAEIYIYTSGGEEYTGDAVATGMSVRRIVGGEVKDELTIIVKGDSNGDGAITITDYTLVRLDILELKLLSGGFTLASDVNGDGAITITDYTLIRLHILELKPIT